MMKVLAKSNPEQSLIEHINDCIKIFDKVILWKRSLLEKFSERSRISCEKLIQRAFLIVAFHDVGKATYAFQKKIRNEKHPLESHALASLIILNNLFDEPLLSFRNKPFFPELLAVATHHTSLRHITFDHYHSLKVEFITEYLPSYFANVSDWAQKLNIAQWPGTVFDSGCLQEFPADIFYDSKDAIAVMKSSMKGDEDYQTARDIFVLLKGILHYCDWLASKANEQKADRTTNYALPKQVDKLMVKKFGQKWQRDFQWKAKNTTGDIFIEIPTGQGKTEAALLWAEKMNKKLIYLLPTMVTSNKMRRRLGEIYQEPNIGLAHSTATYVFEKQLTTIDEEVEDSGDQEVREKVFYSRTFLLPATVSTVDQIIFSFFNWKHWTVANLNAYNSAIVLDEIHAYQAFTFGLIVALLKCLKQNNSSICIMSATLPKALKKRMGHAVGDATTIRDASFDTMQRTRIHLKDALIQDAVTPILSEFKTNQKVLVICNTIGTAKEIFKVLKDDASSQAMMLFHSQFIGRDKQKKEFILELLDKSPQKREQILKESGMAEKDCKEILRIFKILEKKHSGFICIATQIVEVSLDIDFDVMYTENAPIDALVQRMGRVNRKGKEKIANVFIYRESEKSRKHIYDGDLLDATRDLLQKCVSEYDGNLTEAHYKKIVNNIYSEAYLNSKQWQEEYYKGLGFFMKLWKGNLNIVYTLTAQERELQEVASRKIDYVSIEVVLQQHLQELEQFIETKQYNLLPEISVRVPAYIVYGSRNFLVKYSEFGKRGIPILKCKYSEEIGVEYEGDEMNFV